MKTFPLFLVGLAHRRSVVLGGGSEAEHKVGLLLEASARIELYASVVTEVLRRHAAAGLLTWVRRDYEPGDLAGAYLAVAAEVDPGRHATIREEADRERVLLNVVDRAELCDFIMGSRVRRGDLCVGISTGGCAPALAVRLREWLESALGPEYAEFLRIAEGLRGRFAERFPDRDERRSAWYRLVDSDAIAQLRHDRPQRGCRAESCEDIR